MGIAVPNRETVCKARQPPGHPVYVARDALFEARYSNTPAANGEQVPLGIIAGMLEVDLCNTKTESDCLFSKLRIGNVRAAGKHITS
jgi:hypothetical protein